MTQAAIRPTVLLAMPSSWALLMPSFSTKSGAQARVVPTPPVREMEPTIKPALGSSPKASATPMPSEFCSRMNTAASNSRISSGRPPLSSWRMSDFKPMPAKK
ncbi:hypothetical protein D3C81_1590700 [compost metagenome]